MNDHTRPNDLLLLAGKVIAVFMQIALAFAGVVLVLVSLALIAFSDLVQEQWIEKVGETVDFPTLAMIGIMAIGLAIVAALFVFFGKLRNIIATVGEGDPFAPENASRLALMGWLMLAVQLLVIPATGLGLLLAKYADEAENAGVTVDPGLDLEGILLVIILFILARVFRHGAAMREDLEGTV